MGRRGLKYAVFSVVRMWVVAGVFDGSVVTSWLFFVGFAFVVGVVCVILLGCLSTHLICLLRWEGAHVGRGRMATP